MFASPIVQKFLPEAAPRCCTYTTIFVYTVKLSIHPLRKTRRFSGEDGNKEPCTRYTGNLALHAENAAETSIRTRRYPHAGWRKLITTPGTRTNNRPTHEYVSAVEPDTSRSNVQNESSTPLQKLKQATLTLGTTRSSSTCFQAFMSMESINAYFLCRNHSAWTHAEFYLYVRKETNRDTVGHLETTGIPSRGKCGKFSQASTDCRVNCIRCPSISDRKIWRQTRIQVFCTPEATPNKDLDL